MPKRIPSASFQSPGIATDEILSSLFAFIKMAFIAKYAFIDVSMVKLVGILIVGAEIKNGTSLSPVSKTKPAQLIILLLEVLDYFLKSLVKPAIHKTKRICRAESHSSFVMSPSLMVTLFSVAKKSSHASMSLG
jgi:hypothetical protein